jgi:hypothetical protein
MATITVNKVQCLRKQDVSGEDETYLYLDGDERWNGKFDKHESLNPNKSETFSNAIVVALKERNGSGGSPTFKLLGQWTVKPVAVEDDVLTASSSGYHYEVTYTVA